MWITKLVEFFMTVHRFIPKIMGFVITVDYSLFVFLQKCCSMLNAIVLYSSLRCPTQIDDSARFVVEKLITFIVK